MEEKIIELLKETITNKYFLYSVAIITIITIIKSIRAYKLYKLDCAILNQKPKPIGFGINTIINIIALTIISNFAFTGYTIYKHPEIFKLEKNYVLENINKEKKITYSEPNYKIEKITTHNNPAIKHNSQKIIIKKIEKPITRKISAKEKLKRELEQSIRDVN